MTSKDGYSLTKEGLSDMVKDQQRGFLEAYGGPDGLTSALGSDPSRGLSGSADDLTKRAAEFGSNYIEPPGTQTYWQLILAGLEDNTIQALLFCATISILLLPADPVHAKTGWIEGFAIYVTVLIVLNLQASIEYSKAAEFRRQQLELDSDALVKVVRGGAIVDISPKEIVVGDVIRVAVGDVVAVDGVLIEGTDVRMDESALTGEPVLMAKSNDAAKDPFILSGTNVMTGSGKLLAVAVGLSSVQGRIFAAVQGKADAPKPPAAGAAAGDEAPAAAAPADGADKEAEEDFDDDAGGNLAEKLDRLAIDIAKAGLALSTLAVILMICVMFALPKTYTNYGALALTTRILGFVLVGVTILVVAVPEGLPLAVALSLAITMGKLMKDNNRVKHMDACETMGSATTICSDKTGTLTQNKMTVMRCYVAGAPTVVHDGTRAGAGVSDQLLAGGAAGASQAFVDLVAQGSALNSAPTTKAALQADGQWKYQGNATECALLKLTTQLGQDPEVMRAAPEFQDATGQSRLEWGVKAYPFSSERKKMSWVVARPGGGFRLMTKGAPSYVCDYATHAVLVDGYTRVPLDRAACDACVETFQRAAMRTLALAYRDFDRVPAEGWDALLAGGDASIYAAECGVTLVCIVGIEDPLRPTVTRAIQQCNAAGVDVRMCTGDALETAIAISTQCGILRPMDVQMHPDGTVEPKPMFAMTGAEFDERVHKLDETKPKVMRRCFDARSGLVGERLAFPFLRGAGGDKVIDQAAFDLVWPKLRVLARCQPEDKLTLVRGMRRSNVFEQHEYCARLYSEFGIRIFPDHQVVAVTGDGTNDAPALKAANVGFAMGIVGTDIAKQACDIILLDDNFASTVAAVKWGRNVYDSISKFCQFQLTVNISAIFCACLGALCYTNSPLGAVQMLWVNVIMDSLASVALASEPPTEALLLRQPYGKRRPMISGFMWCNMIGQSLYQCLVCCILLFHKDFMQRAFSLACCNHEDGWKHSFSRDRIFMKLVYYLSTDKPEGWNESPAHYQELAMRDGSAHFTIVFNTFVLMQLFNEFNARKLQTVAGLKHSWREWNAFDRVQDNPLFVGVVGATFVLQILLVQFCGIFFKVRALTARQWLWCVCFGLGSFPVQFLINGYILAVYDDPEEMTAVAPSPATRKSAADDEADDDLEMTGVSKPMISVSKP
ncbi:hypothetical protein M885DRAFT_538441 [Pelagophyceae sp. CCMP2097]|nr:hypothetical protein M885DRAFT_538441 [Pelagophyceae sp. CCMP2097]